MEAANDGDLSVNWIGAVRFEAALYSKSHLN